MFRAFLLTAFIAVVVSQKLKVVEENVAVKINNEEYENEIISVDLKKANEDIRFVAQIRIHLVEGNVHVNGHRLGHNQIHQIKMMVQVIDIVKGVRQAPQRKFVQLRVLVEETNTDGVPRLYVEEEFITIGKMVVEQIDVHQIIWESNIRKPITTVKLVESKIHSKPREQDHPMFIHDELSKPHLPKHGYGFDESEGDKHHRHHHRHCHHKHGHGHHHHGHHKNGTVFVEKMHTAKCWYRTLSWKSKILLFSVGFFGLLTCVICCGLCAKRRKARQALLHVSAPIDDTVSVDIKEGGEKSKDAKNGGGDGNKYEFHFEFDNSPVVVDDKKPLVEEA